MKQFFLLSASIACFVLSAFGQVTQDFAAVPNLNTLTSSCWQFSGASLIIVPATGTRTMAVNPTAIGNTAYLMTPYVDLSTSSNISFTYRLSAPLSAGASRTISVRLLSVDGQYTAVGSITLDKQSSAGLASFFGRSPITGVRRLVIEITASNDPSTEIYIDNVTIGGDFNYSSLYSCKDKGIGAATIHYLKTFQGVMVNENVKLQWTVAENENNSYFEVEKSTDGNEFKTVGTIKASGKVAEEAYNYIDPLQSKAYYRLKLVSKSNVRMYSNVVFFKSSAGNTNELTLLQNPIQHSLKFGMAADSNNEGILTVYNQSGIKVFQTSFQAWKGYNVITAQLNTQLKNGLYLLEVSCGTKKSTAKFIKE